MLRRIGFRLTLLVLLAIGVTATYFVVSGDSLFPITKVKIKGDYRYVSKDFLTHSISPYLHAGFLGVMPSQMEETLVRHPWIDKAEVRRIWPDSLEVFIVERRGVMRLPSGQVVDVNGELFKPKPEELPKDLPLVITGEQFSFGLLQEVEKISKILSTVPLFVRKLEKDYSTVRLELTTGLLLVLSTENTLNELQRFVLVFDALTREKTTPIAQIDLRYQHGMAVQWK